MSDRRSFTIIELMLVIGIIGTLSGIVIGAVNPAVQLTSAKDAQRRAMSRELRNALLQYQIDTGVYPDLLPVGNDSATAEPICRYGAADTSDCIDIDPLVDSDYLSDLPTDESEVDINHSGYSVFETTQGQAIVLANHLGLNDAYTTSSPSDYILYWDFEEGSGNPVDSVSAQVTTLGGTTAWAGVGATAIGSTDSLVFDGSSTAEPASPSPGYFHDTFYEKTISLWVTIDGDPASDPAAIYDEGGSTHGVYLGYRGSSNTLFFTTAVNSNDVEISSTSTFPVNSANWIHIAGVYDNGNMTLYINGSEESTGTNGTNVPSHSDGPGFGYVNGGWFTGVTTGFTGKIDDVQIFDRPLTTAEIQAIASGR